MGDSNPITDEVPKFNKQSLRKTDTQEKTYFPTKEEIEEEKKAMEDEKKAMKEK